MRGWMDGAWCGGWEVLWLKAVERGGLTGSGVLRVVKSALELVGAGAAAGFGAVVEGAHI